MLLKEFQSRISSLRDKYNRDLGTLNTYEKQRDEKMKEINKLEKEYSDKSLQKEILEIASEEARENGKEILCGMASSSVQMVFGDNLSIDAELGKKSGVPVADIIAKSKYATDCVETDPAQDDGGGLADVTALSMFMSMGLLVGGNNTAGNFLDEPTKFVSKGNSPGVSEFIKEIVHHTGKQTLIVTHDDYLANIGDTAYRLALDENGTTKVEKL